MVPYPGISSLPPALRVHDLNDRLKVLARNAYPEEFAALVLTSGEVVSLENQVNGKAAHGEFVIDPATWVQYEKDVVAIVHSHPNGPAWPTATDMELGEATGKIIGLMVVTADNVNTPFWWGDCVPTPPLVGRNFRHGPSGTDGMGDCYALIKDFYLVCRHVKIKEFPRDWEWWTTGDLYTKGFPEAGFRPITLEEARPGDVFLGQIRSTVPNHGGILWDHNSILHHLTGRLSARTAIGPWERYLTHWLRYEGDLPPWNPA